MLTTTEHWIDRLNLGFGLQVSSSPVLARTATSTVYRGLVLDHPTTPAEAAIISCAVKHWNVPGKLDDRRSYERICEGERDGRPFLVTRLFTGHTIVDEDLSAIPLARVEWLARGVAKRLVWLHGHASGHGNLRDDNVFVENGSFSTPPDVQLLGQGLDHGATPTDDVRRLASILGGWLGDRERPAAIDAFVRGRRVPADARAVLALLDESRLVRPGTEVATGRLAGSYNARDRVEAELLAVLHASPKDEHARAVYADYCEQHGRIDRAALLRGEPAACELRDARWRAVVADRPIAHCGFRDSFTNRPPGAPHKKPLVWADCNRSWRTLDRTDDDLVRRCPNEGLRASGGVASQNGCGGLVRYCTTVAEIAAAARTHTGIVIDSALDDFETRAAHDRCFSDTWPSAVTPPAPPGLLSRMRGWFRR
jgi:uncharacterized protein (TIGR02996 family)